MREMQLAGWVVAGWELRETGPLARHRYDVVVVPGRLRVTAMIWGGGCGSP
jgi:hypothetical protein